MKNFINSLFLILVLELSLLASAPTIALVLSGGAAKGYAHIPVLEMLDSLNINIDFIVGTSIGANVGALYSVGYNAKDIYDYAYDAEWAQIFSDKTNRINMSYLHKKEASKYQIDFDLKGITPKIPAGIIHGQRAYLELSKILGQYEYIKDFNDLHIPFRCNATDLIKGTDVIFSKGSLITSVRSSTSIPSVFAPVQYKDLLLVDGGVKNNVPVDIAKKLGADIVLTSAVISQRSEKNTIEKSVLNILTESIFIHTSDFEKRNLEMSDYLIKTPLEKGSSMSFNKKGVKNIYKQGKKEVYKNLDMFLEIKNKVTSKKSVPPLKRMDDLNIIIENIKVTGNEKLSADFIINVLGLSINDTLQLKNIHKGINNLYGLGYFDIVRYDLNPNQDLNKTDFEIIVEESSFNKLQTGLKWDAFHELIAAANIKINDFLIPGVLITNEFQFPGIRKNILKVSYPTSFLNLPFYPYYKNKYLKNNVNWFNSLSNGNIPPDAIYEMRTISNSIGFGFIIGRNCGIELGLEDEVSSFLSTTSGEATSLNYSQDKTTITSMNIDIDSRDNALITKNGLLINTILSNYLYNDNNFQSISFDYNLYKSIKKTTLRINGFYKNIDKGLPLHNNIFKGWIDRTGGYKPYFLTSSQITLTGIEVIQHYKELHFKFFTNRLLSLEKNYDNDFELDNPLSSYGVGVIFTSPFGPIEIILSKGPVQLQSKSDKQTILYLNAGFKF